MEPPPGILCGSINAYTYGTSSTVINAPNVFVIVYHDARSIVVLAASCRGQQDCFDGGAWWWWWNEVVLLHSVEGFESSCVSLLCCQLKPRQSLGRVLQNAFAIVVRGTKVVLCICMPLLDPLPSWF